MNQSEFQSIALLQSPGQIGKRTITAAATIAPTTPITKVSGTTAVATITPPTTGVHMLAVIAGTTNGVTTTGNIVGVSTDAASTTAPMLLLYDPIQAKYLKVA